MLFGIVQVTKAESILSYFVISWTTIAAAEVASQDVDRNGLRAAPQIVSLWVNAERGRHEASGNEDTPCRSIAEAIEQLPETLSQSVTIHVAPGVYSNSGGEKLHDDRLALMRRMRPGVSVRIVGVSTADGAVGDGC